MLKKVEEIKMEKRDEVQKGTGYVLIDHLLEGTELPPNGEMFAICTLKSGCSIGSHVHDEDTEYYYCLSGKGEINDNGKVAEFLPGYVNKCGNGDFHAIKNRREEPLRFLVVIIKN